MIPDEDSSKDALLVKNVSQAEKHSKVVDVFLTTFKLNYKGQREAPTFSAHNTFLDVKTAGLSPFLHVELEKIKKLAQLKKIPEENERKLLLFSTYIARFFEHPEKWLSLILFLIQQDALSLPNDLDLEHFIAKVQENGAKITKDLENRIEKELALYQKSDLNLKLFQITSHLARCFSELALLDSGVVNRGFVYDLSIILTYQFLPPCSLRKEFVVKLEELKINPFLSSIIESTGEPALEMKEILRLSLALPPETPIGSLETKKALLTCLLSPLRQGNVGNCFAYVFAMSRFSQDPATLLFDLKEIASKGALTGYLCSVKVPFPAFLTPAGSCSEVPLIINANGEWLDENQKVAGKLDDIPGMKEAFLELGLKTPEVAFSMISAWLKKKKLDSIQIKPKELFFLLEELDGNDFAHPSKRALAAQAAFDQKEANPLLLSWKRILADMCAETTKNATKKKLFEFFKKGLTLFFQEKGVNLEHQEKGLAALTRFLETSVNYRYEPNLTQEKTGLRGAFVLLEVRGHKEFPIHSYYEFETFFEKIIEGMLQKMPGVGKNRNALKSYLLLQMKTTNPQKLKSLWRDFAGSTFEDLLLRYYPTAENTKKIPLQNGSPKKLMAELLNVSQKLNSKKGLFPLEGKGHVFTLWLEHLSELQEPEKILNQFSDTATELSQKKASPDFLERFSRYLIQDTKEDIIGKEIREAIKSLQKEKDLSFGDLRKAFFKKLTELWKEEPDTSTALKIDRCLIAALSVAEKDNLSQYAMHFAKSNWIDKGQDLHFCFFPFPFEEEGIRIGKIREDGKGLSLLYPSYLSGKQEVSLWVLPREKEGKNRLHYMDESHQIKING